ncbi:MAG: F0F1 ATP synthase subunit delta [Trueperaceae bacterium]|nr:MAG: F0F1 ATP synthase subunit delta [Trueperaceae bacterium]
MPFDWFTFFAQIVNFLILLFLLRRFLYGPITRVMDERQKRITDRLEEAREREQEAERVLEGYHQAQEALDEQRQQLLRIAQEQADEAKRALIDEARTEIDAMRHQWQRAVTSEKEAFLQSLRRRVTQETYQVARRALRELADDTLEGRMVRVLVTRLELLEEAEQRSVQEALMETNGEVLIRSAFPLPQPLQQELIAGLEPYHSSVKARFQIDPDLMAGIELSAGGRKLAWTLESHLEQLELATDQTLNHMPSSSAKEVALQR